MASWEGLGGFRASLGLVGWNRICGCHRVLERLGGQGFAAGVGLVMFGVCRTLACAQVPYGSLRGHESRPVPEPQRYVE